VGPTGEPREPTPSQACLHRKLAGAPGRLSPIQRDPARLEFSTDPAQQHGRRRTAEKPLHLGGPEMAYLRNCFPVSARNGKKEEPHNHARKVARPAHMTRSTLFHSQAFRTLTTCKHATLVPNHACPQPPRVISSALRGGCDPMNKGRQGHGVGGRAGEGVTAAPEMGGESV
jgi:hypothetical protein